jgi:hypothetical protein
LVISISHLALRVMPTTGQVKVVTRQGEFVLAINLAVSKKILDTTGHPLHNPV